MKKADRFPKETLFLWKHIYHPIKEFSNAKKFSKLCTRKPTVLSKWHVLMQYAYFLRGWIPEQGFNIAPGKGGHYELDVFKPERAAAIEFVHSLRNPKRVLDKQKALNPFLNICYVFDPEAFIDKQGGLRAEAKRTIPLLIKAGATGISMCDEDTSTSLDYSTQKWVKQKRTLQAKKAFEKASGLIVAKYYVSYPIDKVSW